MGSTGALYGEGGNVARGIVGATCVRRNARYKTAKTLGCTSEGLHSRVHIRSFGISDIVDSDGNGVTNTSGSDDDSGAECQVHPQHGTGTSTPVVD